MDSIKVFLDSDVIISALLSTRGASFEILNNLQITKFISESIKLEIKEVSKRLGINNFNTKLLSNLEVIKINLTKERLVENYVPFVIDQEDSHVVAGAVKAKVNFLLTHNLKHYRVNKIKDQFHIITMKPGLFLQYLRSN